MKPAAFPATLGLRARVLPEAVAANIPLADRDCKPWLASYPFTGGGCQPSGRP